MTRKIYAQVAENEINDMVIVIPAGTYIGDGITPSVDQYVRLTIKGIKGMACKALTAKSGKSVRGPLSAKRVTGL